MRLQCSDSVRVISTTDVNNAKYHIFVQRYHKNKRHCEPLSQAENLAKAAYTCDSHVNWTPTGPATRTMVSISFRVGDTQKHSTLVPSCIFLWSEKQCMPVPASQKCRLAQTCLHFWTHIVSRKHYWTHGMCLFILTSRSSKHKVCQFYTHVYECKI